MKNKLSNDIIDKLENYILSYLSDSDKLNNDYIFSSIVGEGIFAKPDFKKIESVKIVESIAIPMLELQFIEGIADISVKFFKNNGGTEHYSQRAAGFLKFDIVFNSILKEFSNLRFKPH